MKLLIATAILASSLLSGQAAPQKAPSQASQQGRYQIVFSPHARADTYLLDTETGRVWESTTITDVEGQPEIWKFLPRIDSDQDFVAWLSQQRFIPKTPTALPPPNLPPPPTN